MSRQKHDESNPHEIIPISFCMQGVLHDRYYNIGSLETYLVQTRSKAKCSGLKLPEVHGVGKSLDTNILQEKQVNQPLVSKVNVPELLQIKPRLGQGRAG